MKWTGETLLEMQLNIIYLWEITIRGFTMEPHINLVEIYNYSDSIIYLSSYLKQKLWWVGTYNM